MYQEGAPEFVIDQGMYYANYGYYCTGFESPIEWEDHQNFFSSDVQYTGAQTENSSYVYYAPSYGYAQPGPGYNPYNPYIPGAVMGDDPFVGAQQYYTIPSYQNTVSPSAYVPVYVQPDGIPTPSTSTDSFSDTRASIGTQPDRRGVTRASISTQPDGRGVTRASIGTQPDGRGVTRASIGTQPDGRGVKYNVASASAAFPRKSAPNQAHSLSKATDGQSKHYAIQGSVPDSSGSASARAHQVRVASGSVQPIGNIPGGKLPSYRNQLKTDLPVGNAFSDYGASAQLRPKVNVGRVFNDAHGFPDTLAEQNQEGPRTNRLKNQLKVKAYTSKAGNSDAEGNIIINTDQYNKDAFPVDYVDAKFFVIKSYSEDDVHKSIKYNVWSSTPHGNKKLESAHEDARKIAEGKRNNCPIFLFFSVNASGQFCGVAEMIGVVDFQKDMDFWQQDKWSGSFPVKWLIIKDVPNSHFRHIILGNNENKPVTNSRDTQEIMYKQGMEMLKVFKNHAMKTSLLDDFMYYENRQRIMQEEKAMQLIKSFEGPFIAPAFDPANKWNRVELHRNENVRSTGPNGPEILRTIVHSSCLQGSTNSGATNDSLEEFAFEAKHDASISKMSALSINPKQSKSEPPRDACTKTDAVERVNVVSVTVNVNRFTESPGFLTVGTIPLNPVTLQLAEGGVSAKKGT